MPTKDADLIGRTLRAMAMPYNAMLFYHSSDNKALQQQFRTVITRFILDKPNAKSAAQTDPTRPLMIPSGADSPDAIGHPPGGGGLEAWPAAFRRVFPEPPAQRIVLPGEQQLEPEPVVDALWVQKRDEPIRKVEPSRS